MPGARPAQHVIATHRDEWAEVRVRNDHIAEVHLYGRGYNRAIVSKVIDKVRSMHPSEHLLVLILAHPKSSIDPGGIHGLFSRKSLTYSVAKAYVCQKPIHFFLARIALSVYQPKMPIRFFRERAEAEAWLSSFAGYGI
jgi:hypothetical protein